MALKLIILNIWVIAALLSLPRASAEDKQAGASRRTPDPRALWHGWTPTILKVPVECFGKRLSGVIDTGASYTTYDVKLRHLLKGGPRNIGLRTPSGNAVLERFVGRELTIDGNRCDDPEAAVDCADLEFFSRIAGQNVDVVVGMDVLKDFVVHVESEGPTVSLANELTRPREVAVRLRFEGACPVVLVSADGLPSAVREDSLWFTIDTAFLSPTDGALEASIFEALDESDALVRLGSGRGEGVSGKVAQRHARFTGSIALGGQRHATPTFCEAHQSILGLTFLLRYSAVIFDFPNKNVYFASRGAGSGEVNDPRE